MDRTDVAIVVNTCPKFFYLLEPFFGLLRRYGSKCKWPVYLATEKPEEFMVQHVVKKYDVKLIVLAEEDADFMDSRLAAVKALPSEIQYVLPLQEDFLLERPGLNYTALKGALEILDADIRVQSLRLMPCPGSIGRDVILGGWQRLTAEDMKFCYQATLWRRQLYTDFFQQLITQCFQNNPTLIRGTAEYNVFSVRGNPAENHQGQYLLNSLAPGAQHLCWPRKAIWANAVYWCPWPYRPTAVVRGKFEDWAYEYVRREGFTVSPGSGLP